MFLFACAVCSNNGMCLNSWQASCSDPTNKKALNHNREFSLQELPSYLTASHPRKRDSALYVSPKHAYQYSLSGKAVIVDISPQSEFQDRYIPGSLFGGLGLLV